MKVSCCVNVDSRPGVDAESSQFNGHNDGVRHWDLLTDGLENKRLFFEHWDFELIAYADESVPIPDGVLRRMRDLCDCVVIRKHFTTYRGVDQCGYANDIRYLHTLSQATGDVICHFDADTAAFRRDNFVVQGLLNLSDQHRFVSYPSQWTPKPVHDESFGRNTWASTRFFICRREWFQFDVIEKALRDPEWAYATYGQPSRKCPWLEHFLSLTNEESVFYPPRNDENLLVFCWDKYVSDVLRKLNLRSYDEVLAYVNLCQGIHYPCDVTALNL